MAVQKMQCVHLMGLVSQFDQMTEQCMLPFPFEPIKKAAAGEEKQPLLAPFTEENPYNHMVEHAEECLAIAGISTKDKGCCQLVTELSWTEEEAQRFLEVMNGYRGRKTQLEKEKKELEELLKQLEPLKNMKVAFDRLFSMKFIDVRLGKMQKLANYSSDAKMVFVPISSDKTSVWGIVFTPHSERKNTDALLSSLYFQRVYIPGTVHEEPQLASIHIEDRLEVIAEEIAGLDQKMEREVAANKEMLVQVYSYWRYMRDRFNLRSYALRSKHVFHFSGWVEKDRVEAVQTTADERDTVIIQTEDPDEDATLSPPTKLKNLPVIRFFQMFTEMYGVPDYRELDPTFILAITYTLFFGIMFGDLGQGLVLALIGFLLWRFKGFGLGRVMADIGIASAVGGIFYGSVFGLEDVIHGFTVLDGNNPVMILLFAAGFGLTLIALAMILNMINGVRNRDPKKWLFSPNGVMGFLFLFGNIGAGLSLLLAKKNIWSVPYLVLTTIIPLVSIFFAEPLTKLVRGEKKWLPENPSEFYPESFFELFEVLLSYLSNIISYSRIGAFAISHAGMMLVVTNMAKMTGNPATEIAIMIFGNLFVICLEGLIVGIQCLRLQFYEFFSRFYSGNGHPFTPVRLKK